jgi:hypothetical protein
MSEGTTPPPRRDGFIAVRKAELADAIASDAGLPQGDAGALADILRLLGALLHHEAHAQLEGLKALYDPLDPDAPPSRRNASTEAFEAFEHSLSDALTRANFVEIEPDSVQTREATKLLTGLSIKPSTAGIRRIRYFARGARPEQITRTSWFGLRKRVIDAEVMSDVMVLVGF